MRKLLYVIVGMVGALLALGWIGSKFNGSTADMPENKVALKAILKEPKVKDATITDAGVLYVQVVDDGTNRNGYAEYLCSFLKKNYSSVNRVKVVKVNSQNDPSKDNAYGVLLGESWCK